MDGESPQVVVIGGCNGAGKSTSAPRLLRDVFGITRFVNADSIAVGLAAFAPEVAALEAGRVMLERVKGLAAKRESFAFETTLSGRTYAQFLRQLSNDGYGVNLLYFWLNSPDLAIERVKERVRNGGHFVPPEDVARRYSRSIQNFREVYRPMADSWAVFDNSMLGAPVLIAEGSRESLIKIHRDDLCQLFERSEK